MIYLKNNTILQELYIPRQDYISNTTGSSGTYAEGYADGYESGYTSGSTDGFDSGYTSGSTDGYNSGYTEGYDSGSTDGFNSGYTSGETHQKGLLTSTEFTENGEYEREDGWSAITVNVSGSALEGKEIVVSEDITVVTPDSGYDGFSAVTVDATEYGQTNYDSGFDDGYTDGYSSGSSEGYDSGYTEGYQSGSTDGFNSGYTSGETHQKSLLVSTAITENGSYQREDGYSAITVNVPTGTSYNIEENKQFTANTNGYYWVAPSSGSVSVNDHFDRDDDCYYITATTSGYPLNGRYNIFYIEDDFDSSKGQIDVYIENGYLDYDDSDWDGGEVVDYETGDILRLKVRDANKWFDWVMDEDYNLKYDAMTGLGVIVDVPQTGETYSIEDTKAVSVSFTNIPIVVTPTKNNIQVTEITPNKKFSLNASSLSGINYNLYLGRFRDTSINDRYAGNSVIYDGNFFNVDTKYSDYPFTATTEGGGTILTIEFLYPTFEWIGNGDGSDYDLLSGTTISFKPDVSAIDVGVEMSGNVQSIYAVNYGVDYLKGVVVSCENLVNSARTEAQNAIISTFTAMTATTNGVYGSSANPLSSITVNVPQSSGDIKYVEYIETDGTQIGWDTGYNIGTDIDARIYLDFMPKSGNGYGDYWFAYYGDGEQYVLFRRADNANPIGFMFGDNQSVKDESSYSVTDYDRYLISLDKNGITDEKTGTLLVNEISSYIDSTNNLWLNCDGNPQEISRCIIARYYGFRVENGNGETVLDMRPCLDGNNTPCFYDEVSQTYIYHQGSGTPVAGSVIQNPEYQSGYTDGYNSGYTDGSSNGYGFMSYECLNSGAFYPQDPNNQNYSYKTVLPDLLLGQTIVFEITKTSNTDNGTLIGGSTGLSVTYNTRDGASLNVRQANTSWNSASQTAYLTATYVPNSTASTITPRTSQKVTGKIGIDSTGCTYGITCGGVYYVTSTKSGTFRDSYPIVFNSSCSRYIVLNKITYFDNTTGDIIYCFVYKGGEIVNILDGTIAPTYDRNDNLVNGVLEEKNQD